jgi:hypothetical protein
MKIINVKDFTKLARLARVPFAHGSRKINSDILLALWLVQTFNGVHAASYPHQKRV